MSKLSEMMDNLSPACDEGGHPITQRQWDELRQQLSAARELLDDCQGWLRCDYDKEEALRNKVQKFLLDNQ